MRPANNSSVLSFDEDKHIFDSGEIRALFILLYSVVFVFCVLGNLAVVLVVIFHSRMRNLTKFFLGNLAFANLCVGIFCVYQSLTTYLFDSWLYGDAMCKVHYFVQSLCHTASVFLLVAVAVERYLALLHPFRARQLMTLPRLVAVITALWITSGVIASPRLYYFGTIIIPLGYGRTATICIPRRTLYDSALADTLYFALLYVFPLTIITVLYSRIAKCLHRSIALRQCLNGTDQQRSPFVTGHPEVSVHYGSDGNLHLELMNWQGRERSIQRRFRGRQCRSLTFRSASSTTGAPSIQISKDGPSQSADCRHGKRLNQYRVMPRHISDIDLTSTSPSSLPTNSPKLRGRQHVFPRRRRKHICTERASWPVCPTCKAHMIHFSSDFALCGSVEVVGGKRRKVATRTCNNNSDQVVCSQFQPNSARTQLSQRLYAIRVLVSNVMCFALLNLPFHVRKLCLNYLNSYDADSDVNQLITPFTVLFIYTNCAISPILYAFLNEGFRQSFMDLWFRWISRHLGRAWRL